MKIGIIGAGRIGRAVRLRYRDDHGPGTHRSDAGHAALLAKMHCGVATRCASASPDGPRIDIASDHPIRRSSHAATLAVNPDNEEDTCRSTRLTPERRIPGSATSSWKR